MWLLFRYSRHKGVRSTPKGRCCAPFCFGRSQAMHYIDRLDRYRESYYRYHTGRQWKRIGNYDLCLDTAAMGLDNCIEVIKKIVELRFGVKAPQ